MISSFIWFERKFNFDLPVWMFPNIVERLRGTPARLEEWVSNIPVEKLTKTDGSHWSIQEHVGHLLDLEPLWLGRVLDIRDGVEIMRAADLANTKTHQANHNQNDIKALLHDFRTARKLLIHELDKCDEKMALETALHPRLMQPMRLMDLTFFTAEHDDHHLADIGRLR